MPANSTPFSHPLTTATSRSARGRGGGPIGIAVDGRFSPVWKAFDSDMIYPPLFALPPELGDDEQRGPTQKEQERTAQHSSKPSEQIEVTKDGPEQKVQHAGRE